MDSLGGGRYRLKQRIGQGGMATVHLADDRELDRPVAVKLLADNLAAEDLARERFVREARLAARVAHPNVVQIFDVGEEDGRPYIVMELVEGETLADALRARAALPPDQAIGIAIQVADGLACAHAAGLVHRDIKPHNLLWRPDGVIKIADFGIARAVEGTRLTRTGTVLGTGPYLAPEQATGGAVGPAVDIYALGVVTYEAIAGRLPRTFSSLQELAEIGRDDALTPLRQLQPDVGGELDRVVMRCLRADPAMRFGSAEDLLLALGRCAGRDVDGPARRVSLAAAVEPPAEAVPTELLADEGPTELLADKEPPWIEPARALPEVGPGAAAVAGRVGPGETPTTVVPSGRRVLGRTPASRVGLAIALAIVIGISVLLASNGDQGKPAVSSSAPPPPARSGSPAGQAHALARWLRANTR